MICQSISKDRIEELEEDGTDWVYANGGPLDCCRQSKESPDLISERISKS